MRLSERTARKGVTGEGVATPRDNGGDFAVAESKKTREYGILFFLKTPDRGKGVAPTVVQTERKS